MGQKQSTDFYTDFYFDTKLLFFFNVKRAQMILPDIVSLNCRIRRFHHYHQNIKKSLFRTPLPETLFSFVMQYLPPKLELIMNEFAWIYTKFSEHPFLLVSWCEASYGLQWSNILLRTLLMDLQAFAIGFSPPCGFSISWKGKTPPAGRFEDARGPKARWGDAWMTVRMFSFSKTVETQVLEELSTEMLLEHEVLYKQSFVLRRGKIQSST